MKEKNILYILILLRLKDWISKPGQVTKIKDDISGTQPWRAGPSATAPERLRVYSGCAIVPTVCIETQTKPDKFKLAQCVPRHRRAFYFQLGSYTLVSDGHHVCLLINRPDPFPG